ncbi:MAG TPA: contractile injection system tape measure protein [Geobacteraceae bacterium]
MVTQANYPHDLSNFILTQYNRNSNIFFMSTHSIQRQYLYLELTGAEADGVALQQKLPGFCQDRLAPAIERVLDRYAPVNGHILFERLEIATVLLALDRLEQDLADAVAKALEESLRKQLAADRGSLAAGSDTMWRKTERESIHDAFIHFLKHGTLPWSFRLPAGRTLEQEVLVSWRLPDRAWSGLHRTAGDLLVLLKSDTVRKRLVRQFSLEFLKSTLLLVSPSGTKVFDEILTLLQSVSLPSDGNKMLERVLGETILTSIAMGVPLTKTDLLKRLHHALAGTFTGQGALAGVAAQLRTGAAVEESVVSSRQAGTIPAKPHLTAKRRSSRDIAAAGLLGNSEPTLSSGDSPETPAPIKSPGPSAQGAEQRYIFSPETGAGIYIENAGLALLHPFLPLYFEALAVASEDRLLQPERALCLLHYLTTGEAVAPEYELFLPKILCNLNPETPVESDVGLTGMELDESVALLEAVIRHWEALGNSSPDALRGTFLLRKGKISQRENDWLLQVESQTCDILLGQLPWGISMIKLPWMKKTLWVEWR